MLWARRFFGSLAARALSAPYFANKTFLIWATIATGLLLYIAPLLLPTPLLDPDEGLHAAISQEMVETGEYVIPRFRGEPFLDKPIVYFWTQALSLRLFGMNEAAVRLPGLLFGVLGALTAGLLARSLFNRSVGLLATLIALAMPMPFILAQAASHDVALVPWTNLALLALWHADHQTQLRRKLAATLGAALAMDLAILTKGLIGVAFVAIAYGLYVLVDRRLRLAVVATSFGALFLGLLIASPWFLAFEVRSPGYLHYYFWQRHVLGFVTKSQLHATGRWYYYLMCLLPGTLPWSIHAAALLPGMRRNSRQLQEASAIKLLLAWFIGGLVFLTLARSKLITYALPLCPAVAILAAVAWERLLYGRSADQRTAAGELPKRQASPLDSFWLPSLIYSGAALGMIAPLATLAMWHFLGHVSSLWLVWLAALAPTLIAVATWRYYQIRLLEPMLGTMAIWAAAFFLLLLSGPGQLVGERYSLREVARQINAQKVVPQKVVIIGNGYGSLIFYLHPSLRRNLVAGQIQEITRGQLADHIPLPAGALLVLSGLEFQRAQQTGVVFDASGWTTPGNQHVFLGPGIIQTQVATGPATSRRE